MENVLNRRMFQQPIHAKSGVYVPTIEDILQFYQGEFNANGEPIDQEALMRAADIATIAGAAANKDNSQFLLDDEMAEKYKALGANIIPDGRGAQMFGTDVQAGDTRSDDGWNIDDLPLNAEELLQQEKAKVLGGPDLKIHDYDNMPADLQEKVEAMDKSENDYAQEQLLMDKLNNQRGRIDDRSGDEVEQNVQLYGLYSYNCIKVSEMKNKMGDDVRILFTEYRQKRKGKFDSNNRRIKNLENLETKK